MKNILENLELKMGALPVLTAPRLRLISTFIVGQGAVQVIQVLSGFFLVRWLSIEEYAQYSVAFAFQSTAQMLVEFGFSGAIVALVGNRINDKSVIGNYIKAGQFYRNRFFIVVGGACIVLFPLLTSKHDWPLFVTVALLICIISNLFFSGNISYYTPPLIIHKKIRSLYQIQLKNGTLRFLLIVIFYFSSVLNAWLAVLTTSLLTLVNGLAFRKKAGEYVEEPEKASKEVREEMFNYIRPIMPGIVFSAFQGQMMIFIISIFGQTQGIAEVGALTKIGQLFLIFGTAGSVLVAPYLAKQSIMNLMPKYLSIASIYIILASSLIILAHAFPNFFLWIIGSKYQHLNEELVLVFIISGLGMINGLLWNMNASRKWVYNWMPKVNIPGVILLECFLVFMLDLSTVKSVLLFSLYIMLFRFLMRVIVGIYGFKQDKKLIESTL